MSYKTAQTSSRPTVALFAMETLSVSQRSQLRPGSALAAGCRTEVLLTCSGAQGATLLITSRVSCAKGGFL